MNNLNPFYSIRSGTNVESEHQLEDLGSQRILAIVGGGSRRNYDWDGADHSGSQTFYTSTTAEDYDRAFANRIIKIKPVYEIDGFLNYHYTFYIQNGQSNEKFLKHMKYVVLPLLKEMKNTETHITLFNEWLNSKTLNVD